MRLSDGVEGTVHCCVLLSAVPEGECLSGARLAEFHGVPGPYLTKHLQALTRAGVLVSVPGPNGGYRLARPADDVTVLDVVEAIDGGEAAFRCTEIPRRGPTALPDSAYRRRCGIDAVMLQADEAWRRELRSRSIGDVVRSLGQMVPQAAAEKTMAWLGPPRAPGRAAARAR